jgi:hypothetical protein
MTKKSASERAQSHRTCASCKRTRPVAEMEDGRARCKDRAACREALTTWLSKETFVSGAQGFDIGEAAL